MTNVNDGFGTPVTSELFYPMAVTVIPEANWGWENFATFHAVISLVQVS